jgi:hypothetical protein
MTYQITISNSAGKQVLSKTFDDTDGILDLELVPSATSHPMTWGPDFAGQEGYGSTGTFHIQGPFRDGGNYLITVDALSKDNSLLNSISDTFSVNLNSK